MSLFESDESLCFRGNMVCHVLRALFELFDFMTLDGVELQRFRNEALLY